MDRCALDVDSGNPPEAAERGTFAAGVCWQAKHNKVNRHRSRTKQRAGNFEEIWPGKFSRRLYSGTAEPPAMLTRVAAEKIAFV